MVKEILYVDMDNVIVNFRSAFDKVSEEDKINFKNDMDEIPGIFAKMDPMPGAIDAYKKLSAKYDTYILSTAPWENSSAWSDKIEWVKKHLGEVAYKRLILSHNKNLNKGDYLIDDRPNNGAENFEGEWLHFGQGNRFPDWNAILEYLL
jgi:5'(3')-deoxyribonucleotidase